jgi:hypothetical protein
MLRIVMIVKLSYRYVAQNFCIYFSDALEENFKGAKKYRRQKLNLLYCIREKRMKKFVSFPEGFLRMSF